MSLNDPQWGKRGAGGPPDLDEIWRNVNRRLNELLGRKRRQRRRRRRRRRWPRRRCRSPASGILVLLVVVVWLASGFYIVDEGRRGVVTRFGKYTETTQPGARWHLPFPIEEKELVDFSQVSTVEVGYRNTPKNKKENEALMLTDDENIIDIQFAVQYNLKSAEAYLFNVRKPDLIVQFIAQTAMGEVVGKAKMDFVLYEGREQIAKSAEKLMQEMLDRYQTGVYVQKVTLQSVQPPDKVQAAFDDAVKAGQDRERFRNEGQAYANDVVPARAATRRGSSRKRTATRPKSCSGPRATRRASGRSSSSTRRRPGVTRERLYLDMMQTVVGNSSKVLVDQKAGSSSLLYLPLDKLIQQSGRRPARRRRRRSVGGAAIDAAGARADGHARPEPFARGAAQP